MKIEIEKSVCEGMSLVTFSEFETQGVATSFTMPAELATQLAERADFKHGINYGGKLVALFKDEADRDCAKDELEDFWPSNSWEEVTL